MDIDNKIEEVIVLYGCKVNKKEQVLDKDIAKAKSRLDELYKEKYLVGMIDYGKVCENCGKAAYQVKEVARPTEEKKANCDSKDFPKCRELLAREKTEEGLDIILPIKKGITFQSRPDPYSQKDKEKMAYNLAIIECKKAILKYMRNV